MAFLTFSPISFFFGNFLMALFCSFGGGVHVVGLYPVFPSWSLYHASLARIDFDISLPVSPSFLALCNAIFLIRNSSVDVTESFLCELMGLSGETGVLKEWTSATVWMWW